MVFSCRQIHPVRDCTASESDKKNQFNKHQTVHSSHSNALYVFAVATRLCNAYDSARFLVFRTQETEL